MTLATNAGARFVTIDASSQAAVAATGSAVTTVELAVPATARRRAPATRIEAARAAPPTPPRPRRPRARAALPHDVLVIGDSLAVGMADTLRASLPGWRVSVEAKISRPLATGMQILAGAGRRAGDPRVQPLHERRPRRDRRARAGRARDRGATRRLRRVGDDRATAVQRRLLRRGQRRPQAPCARRAAEPEARRLGRARRPVAVARRRRRRPRHARRLPRARRAATRARSARVRARPERRVRRRPRADGVPAVRRPSWPRGLSAARSA